MATDTISPLVSLAGLLGGTKTTSSAGDTSALQAVLGQLQQQQAGGYEQLLQSIFSQASGQIPGFTNAFANAQGARSRGNSAIQTALAELLKQTTLEGQKQIVAQQQANTGQQIQAGGAIAQATKGSTGTSGTNLGNAAKNLAILQLLSKAKDTPLVTSGMSAIGNLFGGGASVEPASAAAPNLFATDAARYDAGTYQAPQDAMQLIDFSQPSMDTQPMQAFDNFVNLPEYQPTTDEIPANYEELWGFADGGLVPRIQRNFADGGLVTQRAAGGRRSAAPSIQTTAPTTTATDNTLPREQLTTQPTAPAPTLSDTLGGLSITDIAGGEGNVSFGGGDPAVAGAVRSGYNTLNTINSGLGQLGQSNIEGFGVIGGLMNARNNTEAVKNAGIGMLGMLSAPAGAIAKVASDPTKENAIDAVSMFSAPTAALNLGMGLFDTSIGTVIGNVIDRMSPNNPVGPNHQYADVGGNADPAGGFGSADAVGGMNAGDAAGVGGETADTGYAADGGEIPGETTGIDDGQTIKVSGGEFVISADVVDAVGADFFEMLQQALHTPAAVQRKRA